MNISSANEFKNHFYKNTNKMANQKVLNKLPKVCQYHFFLIIKVKQNITLLKLYILLRSCKMQCKERKSTLFLNLKLMIKHGRNDGWVLGVNLLINWEPESVEDGAWF